MPPLSYGEDLAQVELSIQRMKQQIAETKQSLSPPERISAEQFVRALREVLAQGAGDPSRRRAVIKALVYEIQVSKTDIDLILRDPSAAQIPMMTDGTDGRFDIDQVWLA